MSKNFSMASNVAYLLTVMRRRFGWGHVARCVADVMLGVALPFLGAALPSFVVGILASGLPAPAALALLAAYVAAYQLARVGQAWSGNHRRGACGNVRTALMGSYLSAVLTADYDYLQTEEAKQGLGACQTCFVNGPDSGSEALLAGLFDLLTNLGGVLVYGVIVGWGRPALLAFLVAVSVPAVVAAVVRQRREPARLDEELVSLGQYDHLIGEALSPRSAKDVLVYRMRSIMSGELDAVTARVRRVWAGQWRDEEVAGLVSVACSLVRDAVAYALLVGMVGGFGAWMSGLFDALTLMVQKSSQVSAWRAFERSCQPRPRPVSALPTAGRAHQISFEHVCYSYDGEKDALHDLTLTIGAGEKVALVGPNGAGKTTLMARAWRPSVACAAAIVAVSALAGVVTRVCEYHRNDGAWVSWLAFQLLTRRKALNLDYETLSSPAFQSRIATLDQTVRIKGGLSMIPAAYRALLESALSIVTCLALMVALVASVPAQGGVLGALASPVASAALLACAVVALVRGQAAVSSLSKRVTEKFSLGDGVAERQQMYFFNLIVGPQRDGKVERVFGMRDMLMGAYDKVNEDSRDFYDRWRAGNRRVAVASSGVNGAFIVASYLLVAVKVLAGAISIGAFTQYAGALAQLGTAWSSLVSRNNDLREHCSYLEEFLAILDMPEASERGSIPPEKRDDGEHELAFEHVSFSYPGSSEEILHDVTLKLGMKRKMAVVGPNGAGKTTFIKLLCRLYRPTSGRITLNGIDIEKYDEDEYRDLMAVVFQDFRLFAFPVWENLAAGYQRDDARLWAALDQADAGFVRAWPDGLETRLYNDLGPGIAPSGGQAQKLALARALYKDAPVVILDEPTAALDPISEAEVYAGFDRMVAGKTAIYISHRMSSCRFCDDIIVFDGGRVVERGGHEGLLAAGGLYASLWNAQASYYVDGEKSAGAQKS